MAAWNPKEKLKALRRRMACAAGLAPVFALIYYSAFWLRFEGQLPQGDQINFAHTVVWVVLTKLMVFGWFRIYQGWNRFVTFHDLVVLIQAATASAVTFSVLDYLLSPELTVPRSVFLMDWGATIVVVGGIRSVLRMVREGWGQAISSADSIPVFIVGANASGETLLRAIRHNHRLHYHVAGFVSDNASQVGSLIGGAPVVGLLGDIVDLTQRYGVEEILITSGELTGLQVRELVAAARVHSISVKVLPSFEQLLKGSLDLRPRTVSIEDLLRRAPVQLHPEKLRYWLDDRVLLVTGSSGSIGSEICRQLLQFRPRRLVLVDRSENGQFFLERELRALAPECQIDIFVADVGDALRMSAIFNRTNPDVVFHAAAYKHVPLMEQNPGEGVKNICLATRSLADLADQHKVGSFVMISTDKAVNPTSIMGACKRVAELYVQSLASRSKCRFTTVRFGNVLDSAGSVVPVFREQIQNGGPVTVTHPDMTRYFMTIPEASQLVMQAGAMGQGGDIFVLDMGDPVRIVDLAKDMIELSDLRVGDDIAIEFTGIRPGEKLFEELHVEGERHLATSHPKIMVAESDKTPWDEIQQAMRSLQRLGEASNEQVEEELKRIVPQFRRFSPADERRRTAA